MTRSEQPPAVIPSEQRSRHGRGRRIAAWVLAPTVVMSGAVGGAVAYSRIHHERAQQKQEELARARNIQQKQEELARVRDDARVAIAAHRFLNPQLKQVVDTGKIVKAPIGIPEDLDTVELTLRLPENPQTAKIMKRYAHGYAVNWQENPGLTSATIVKGANGKYRTAGGGFEAPIAEQLVVRDGAATAVVMPHTDDPVGMKVALYVTNDTNTMDNGKFVETIGQQYVGAIELTEHDGHREWTAMPDQPQLPDSSSTTSQTPQN